MRAAMAVSALLALPMACRAQSALERLRASSVRVVTDVCIGTGYVIDDNGAVATNRHVLAGSREARVECADGNAYAVGEVLGEDTLRDIVVLRIAELSGRVPSIRFRSTPPEPNEKVFLLGNEFDARFSPLSGTVIALDSNPVYGPFLRLHAPVIQGYSGGAVADTTGAALATVVSFTDDTIHGRVCYAIPNVHLANIRTDNPRPFRAWVKSVPRERAGLLEMLIEKANGSMRAKRYKQAIEYFRQVFALFALEAPAETFYNYALSCYYLNDFETARKGFLHYTTRVPEDPDGPYLLGCTYESLGDFASASGAFEQALRLKPDDPDLMYRLAIVLFKNGDTTRACEIFRRLKPISRKHAESLRIQIGTCEPR
ncbi:MAG: trypsin-like peptidase domain-containing protein [Bacteroidota bacterium]|nr:trypsin-like peptidase domain-containing protein [Bacteroidota bacterium]